MEKINPCLVSDVPYLWVRNQGQFPDVLHILVVSSLGRGKVEATGGELVGVVKDDLVVIEDLQ